MRLTRAQDRDIQRQFRSLSSAWERFLRNQLASAGYDDRALQYTRYIVQQHQNHIVNPVFVEDIPFEQDDDYDSDDEAIEVLNDLLEEAGLAGVANDPSAPPDVRQAAADIQASLAHVDEQSNDVSSLEVSHPQWRWEGNGQHRRPVNEVQFQQLRVQRLHELRAQARAQVLERLRARAANVSNMEADHPQLKWQGPVNDRRPVKEIDYEGLRAKRYAELQRAQRAALLRVRRAVHHDLPFYPENQDDDEEEVKEGEMKYEESLPDYESEPAAEEHEEEKEPADPPVSVDDGIDDEIERLLAEKRANVPRRPIFKADLEPELPDDERLSPIGFELPERKDDEELAQVDVQRPRRQREPGPADSTEPPAKDARIGEDDVPDEHEIDDVLEELVSRAPKRRQPDVAGESGPPRRRQKEDSEEKGREVKEQEVGTVPPKRRGKKPSRRSERLSKKPRVDYREGSRRRPRQQEQSAPDRVDDAIEDLVAEPRRSSRLADVPAVVYKEAPNRKRRKRGGALR